MHSRSPVFAMTLLAVAMFFFAPPHATADDDSAVPFSLRRRTIRTDHHYCGMDCLYVFVKQAGLEDVSLVSIEREVPMSPSGVSLENIVKYCNNHGVHVTVIKTDISHLSSCGFPLILHVNTNHYINIVGIEANRIVVFDNSIGLFDCSPEWFAERYDWDGVCVMYGPPSPRILLSMYSISITWVMAILLVILMTLMTYRIILHRVSKRGVSGGEM